MKAEQNTETNQPKKPVKQPAAGPHAQEHLIDNERTPGAGTLPSRKNKGEADPGAG